MTPERVEIGDATLYHGDALKVIRGIPDGSIDAIVVDPPYGIGEARGKNKSRGNLAVAKDYGVDHWDDSPCSPELIGEMRRVSRWQIIFGGNYFNLPPSSCWLVWDKLNGANDFADCELAWTNLRKAVRRIQYRWNGMIRWGEDVRVHPTQKPVEVMRWCIRHLPPTCATIFDPMMGSGTTLVAAMAEGRKAVGVEIDAGHFATAVRRVTEAACEGPQSLFRTKTPDLFAGVGPGEG